VSGYPDSMENTRTAAEILENLAGVVEELEACRDSIERLRIVSWIISNADDLIRRDVASARYAGESWATIGGALGMSRQSAHERFRL